MHEVIEDSIFLATKQGKKDFVLRACEEHKVLFSHVLWQDVYFLHNSNFSIMISHLVLVPKLCLLHDLLLPKQLQNRLYLHNLAAIRQLQFVFQICYFFSRKKSWNLAKNVLSANLVVWHIDRLFQIPKNTNSFCEAVHRTKSVWYYYSTLDNLDNRTNQLSNAVNGGR